MSDGVKGRLSLEWVMEGFSEEAICFMGEVSAGQVDGKMQEDTKCEEAHFL